MLLIGIYVAKNPACNCKNLVISSNKWTNELVQFHCTDSRNSTTLYIETFRMYLPSYAYIATTILRSTTQNVKAGTLNPSWGRTAATAANIYNEYWCRKMISAEISSFVAGKEKSLWKKMHCFKDILLFSSPFKVNFFLSFSLSFLFLFLPFVLFFHQEQISFFFHR